MRHDMDRRLLERTIELAKSTRAFDWKKLPKTLRVVDSRPLQGAGRVEDTINLLGHAGRKIAECMAAVLETDADEVCQQAGAPLLSASSIKAGLDIDWNDAQSPLPPTRPALGVGRAESEDAPLSRDIEALAQVQQQDLEFREKGGMRIRQGVAEDRRVSIEDAEMRHGRKSKSKRFNGFKQHVSTHSGCRPGPCLCSDTREQTRGGGHPDDEKAHVTIPKAMHRTFDSTCCEQMQSSAAIAQKNNRALLDRHTPSRILNHPTSGVAMDYCGFETFSSPTDVRPIVKILTGFHVTETNVPGAGLTAADLRPQISEMAITFFEHFIGRPSSRWHHFQDDFPIGWLIRHHSNRSRSDEYREADERCHANNKC